MSEILTANWMVKVCQLIIFYGSLLCLQSSQVLTSAIERSTLSHLFLVHLNFLCPVLTLSSNYAES